MQENNQVQTSTVLEPTNVTRQNVITTLYLHQFSNILDLNNIVNETYPSIESACVSLRKYFADLCHAYLSTLQNVCREELIQKYTCTDEQLLNAVVLMCYHNAIESINRLLVAFEDSSVALHVSIARYLDVTQQKRFLDVAEETDLIYINRYYNAMATDYGFQDSQSEEIATRYFKQESELDYAVRYRSAYIERKSIQFKSLVEDYRRVCEQDSVVLDTINKYLLARDATGTKHEEIKKNIIAFMRTIATNAELSDFECLVKGIQKERAIAGSVVLNDDDEISESLQADIAAIMRQSSFESEAEQIRTSMECAADVHFIDTRRLSISGLHKIGKSVHTYIKSHGVQHQQKVEEYAKSMEKRKALIGELYKETVQNNSYQDILKKAAEEKEEHKTAAKPEQTEVTYTEKEMKQMIESVQKKERKLAAEAIRQERLKMEAEVTEYRRRVDASTNNNMSNSIYNSYTDPYKRPCKGLFQYSGFDRFRGNSHTHDYRQSVVNYSALIIFAIVACLVTFALGRIYLGLMFGFAAGCLFCTQRRYVKQAIILGAISILFLAVQTLLI